ncbi:hypothetical protein OPV22_005792 [Ensete ventricosum]|uniref:Uncharacterized protein n=1 Tax=Ensete ventricosum TaxID=4639 RepID=A0AAV8RJG4_ENSVE|nr:hypothetical protein OPV22_005792 [Ensete ventricosum]
MGRNQKISQFFSKASGSNSPFLLPPIKRTGLRGFLLFSSPSALSLSIRSFGLDVLFVLDFPAGSRLPDHLFFNKVSSNLSFLFGNLVSGRKEKYQRLVGVADH